MASRSCVRRTRLSRSWSASVDSAAAALALPIPGGRPSTRRVVLRPIVPVTLVGADELTISALALVDSGCEHVLVSQGLARSVGLDYRATQREICLGIGGATVSVRFLDATLRLHPDGGGDDEYIEWQTEVGILREWRPVLGQVGFLDQFTVTLSRLAGPGDFGRTRGGV